FPELGEWTTPVRGLATRTAYRYRAAGLTDPALPDGPQGAWTETEFGALVLTEYTEAAGAEADDDSVDPNIPLAVVRTVRVGDGVVVSLADVRLLWNGFLVDPDNEVFLGDLIFAGQVVDDWPMTTPPRIQLATAAGGGSDSPAASLANARLLPFVLQFLAWWAVLGLWRGWPFGVPRDPPDAGRLQFADHIRAMARRYKGARATRHAASWYARLWLARLKPAGIVLAAQRHGRTPEQARALADRVAALARDPGGADTPDDLDLVEDLWTITHRR
ncbi:MAG: hypothetical protein ACI8PZ_005380, partial [Myxococcota bacterium]